MKLENWLKTHEITPTTFSRRIGCSHTAILRYIDGTRMPRPAQMAAIQRETGGAVNPSDFYPASSGPASSGEAA